MQHFTLRGNVRKKAALIRTLLGQIKDLTAEPVVNVGKGLDEVEQRQRRRKVCPCLSYS